MTQPTLYLTTCGTSLLGNQSGPDRSRLNKTANTRASSFPEEELAFIGALADRAQAALQVEGDASARRASAELASILTYVAEQGASPVEGTPDHHLLIVTDTYQGHVAAKLIREWMEERGWTAELLSPPDLRVEAPDEFRWALAALAKDLSERLPGYRDAGYRIVFNLTGGFKGVNAFLQTAAGLWADEAFYIFDNREAVMRIPRLPVRFAAEDWFLENVDLARRIARGHATVEEAVGAPEALTLVIGREVALSEWGEILWSQARNIAFGQAVHWPPGGRLKRGAGFDRSIAGLAPDRLRHVNEALEALDRWIETGKEPPKSRTVKKLTQPQPNGATHEIYAWSDQDARRIYYCLTKDGVEVIGLGEHR